MALVILQPFGKQAHAPPDPEDQFDLVGPFGVEHIDSAGKDWQLSFVH